MRGDCYNCDNLDILLLDCNIKFVKNLTKTCSIFLIFAELHL